MFTVIPQDTFEAMQMDAGLLLKTFNPASPAAPADEAIITATTGGINVVCQPSYSDLGEDVDNCPNNTKEMKHLDSWDCRISTTALGTSAEAIKLALGAADIDSQTSKITPRRNLEQTDFSDIWWVGDRADGGMVAIQLKNALSTEVFSLQTTKNGKGQIALTITGHVSINAQKVVPMVFYSADPTEVTEFKVSQILSHVTSDFEDEYIASGEDLEVTLTAETGYTIANVVVTVDGTDVTSDAWASATGKVTVENVAGEVVIVATATTA